MTNPFEYSASIRYIVFLIDTKIKDHDGKVFCSYQEAKQYTAETIKEKYADKAVIGIFSMVPNANSMLITMVETIGFSGDKKNIAQLNLFKKTNH